MPKMALRDITRDPSLPRRFQAMLPKKKKRKGQAGGSVVAPTSTKMERALNPSSTLVARDRKRKAVGRR